MSPGRAAASSAPGHRGVAADDPRNARPIDFFRPMAATRASALARLAPYYRRRSLDELEAAVDALMRRIETGPIRPDPPLSQPLEAAPDPWFGLSTHPDIVEEMWAADDALPTRCRWLLWGRPALVHPTTGVAFAIGVGSIGWAARLPEAILANAAPAEAAASVARPPAEPFDIGPAGPAWRFLLRAAPRLAWVRAAFDLAAEPA